MSEIARSPAFRFRLDDWLSGAAGRTVLRPFGTLLDHLLGIAELRRLYARLPRNEPFWDAALDALGIDYAIASGDLARLPPSGPLVVVANHPFGALDGLILMSLLARVRPDVRLLANYLLDRIPQFRNAMIPVDPFGAPSRRGMNAAAARSAIRWLEAGHAVALFPAGEVSHAGSGRGDPAEAEWSPGAAHLVQRTGADMLPIFFHGRNSRLFQFAGRLHPLVRTALLPRELLEKRGHRIEVTVGRCMPNARLVRLENPRELVSYARMRTLALARTVQPAARRHGPTASRPALVAEAESPDVLEREIKALAPSQILVRGGVFDVCLARSQEIPRTLLDIGRQREIAFRAAGEGSGQPRDLDRFDRHYLHLFVWDRERRAIAGAYRIGATDEILPRFGVTALYTNTLFRFDERLLAAINPALELGRAFVPPEYQRDYSPLLLLWRAIAAFVFDNPRYRMLFGPVSISNTYQSVSRQILARFLYATSYRADLGELVVPRNPPAFLRHGAPVSPAAGSLIRTLADVGALLAEIEADQKGVPVLVRQYLKLNARLLGFNLDPAFGSVLDGLMLVDLVEVDRTILARYMGAERATRFLALHGAAPRRRAS